MAATADEVAAGPVPEAGQGHPRRWRILAVLAAVAFMAQLDLFIVNIAVPAIGHSFGGSLSGLSWVLNANAIVFAALLVPAGRLADQFGRRRFLLAGVGLFTLSTTLSAVAPGLGVLVAGRALQGAGAAMMVPTSLGLLLSVHPKSQHTKMSGVWAGIAGLGGACGGPLAGLLVGIDWRLVFLVNVPIGVATLLVGSRVLPETRGPQGTRLPDPLSIVTLLAAVTLCVLAIVQGSSWGWASPSILALFAGSAFCAMATVRRSLHQPNAVIEAALFHSRAFATGTVALLLYYVAFSTWLLATVMFLQDGWHYGLVESGLALAPAPLVAAIFGANSGRIAARVGTSVLAVGGPLCMALAGVFWLTATPAHAAYLAGFLPGLVLAGISSGLTQAALYATTGTLPAKRQATGSAVLNTSRQIGTALGVAVLVLLLGTAHAHDLAAFQRGWTLIVLAATSASATVLVGSVHRTARSTTASRPSAVLTFQQPLTVIRQHRTDATSAE